MLDNADVLVCYKEYPHTDVLERALELVDLCAGQVEGGIKPVAAVVDCEMAVTDAYLAQSSPRPSSTASSRWKATTAC